jgi:uncharacterized SAM-binding protein YcdF (DUF218 family)
MPWTGVLRSTGAAVVAGFLVTVYTPLPGILGPAVSGTAPLERAGAIVVLGGGGVRPDGHLSDISLRRALHGIGLYRRDLAPLLVFSGGAADGPTEAEARAALARTCGIAPGAILTDSRSRTTREEGVNIAARLLPQGVRKIVLVADAEGMSRAAGVFEKVGFEVVPSPVAEVSGDGGPEERLALVRRLAMELVGRLYYRIAGYI